MKYRVLRDGAVIGSALFSMFFGAGNMIFPPYLGMQSGFEWFIGFLCYFLADIGLAIAVISAMVKHGDFENVLSSVTGKYISKIVMVAVILCLGPFICIPRTAATTFELAVLPLVPVVAPWVCYIVFFVLVYVLCIKETGIVDVVGKLMTPLLFAGLVYIILVGVMNPIGDISDTIKTHNVAYAGIDAGYQSLDALAAAVFGTLIITSARHKGYPSGKTQNFVVAISCVVAGFGLFVIYMGLTYLGATVSEIFDNHTLRSELLIGIVERLVPGRVGVMLFSVISGLACLSTAVAVTGSCAGYLSKATGDRISYISFLTVICIFSTVVSFAGVDRLVSFASPVLNILYPPVMIIVLISFFIKKNRM